MKELIFGIATFWGGLALLAMGIGSSGVLELAGIFIGLYGFAVMLYTVLFQKKEEKAGKLADEGGETANNADKEK